MHAGNARLGGDVRDVPLRLSGCGAGALARRVGTMTSAMAVRNDASTATRRGSSEVTA